MLRWVWIRCLSIFWSESRLAQPPCSLCSSSFVSVCPDAQEPPSRGEQHARGQILPDISEESRPGGPQTRSCQVPRLTGLARREIVAGFIPATDSRHSRH